MSPDFYKEEDLLALSGLQHLAFCERQWGLLVLEQQWKENQFTVEGKQLHQRVDDPFIIESRGELVVSRSVPLCSYQLGIYGVADIVEWHYAHESKPTITIELTGHPGYWYPCPVEYKRGKLKPDDRDEVQLCGQAMCLEEMLNIRIESGDLYYGLLKHRYPVTFSQTLRERVIYLANRMHQILSTNQTPRPIFTKACEFCSMKDVCIPKLSKQKLTAKEYIQQQLSHLKELDE